MNNWDACKQWVEEQTAMYEDVIEKNRKAHPERVHVLVKNKSKVIAIDLDRVNGYEVELLVVNHQTKGVVQARYIAWDSIAPRSYVRDLMNPSEFEHGNA